VQAKVRTRVVVTTPEHRLNLSRVEVISPETSEMQPLLMTDAGFTGTFKATEGVAAVQIRLYEKNGESLEVTHPYVSRGPGDEVVERLPGTGGTRLLAVTLGPDGTVWSGGDRGASLYQVMPGSAQAQLVRPLLSDPAGRIEDLVVDALGRLHAVVFSSQRSGVIVRHQDAFCQSVNVLDADYPLRDAEGSPSVGTRAVAASNGAIWLLGSDGGVAQVSDAFRNGACPATGVEVQYAPVLRREDGVLPANTVPALAVSHDGALWIGSALGLGRLQDGHLTRMPFDPELSFQGDAATLETFFQEVAQAIFEARPIDSVSLGDVSFVDAFGSTLVKEDFIFSLAAEPQGGLWIGTLGGGIRRVEAHGDTVEQTLHLTREDGLAGNMIFALAMAPDGAVWAATDDGVSRIEAHGDQAAITTYSTLDALALPARDIAVDIQGTVWVATDGGLFRIQTARGQIAGQVQDATAQPVAEA
jgi:ligand-binding sensor domain-containing protein